MAVDDPFVDVQQDSVLGKRSWADSPARVGRALGRNPSVKRLWNRRFRVPIHVASKYWMFDCANPNCNDMYAPNPPVSTVDVVISTDVLWRSRLPLICHNHRYHFASAAGEEHLVHHKATLAKRLPIGQSEESAAGSRMQDGRRGTDDHRQPLPPHRAGLQFASVGRALERIDFKLSFVCSTIGPHMLGPAVGSWGLIQRNGPTPVNPPSRCPP